MDPQEDDFIEGYDEADDFSGARPENDDEDPLER